jgi:hypothetical protein
MVSQSDFKQANNAVLDKNSAGARWLLPVLELSEKIG